MTDMNKNNFEEIIKTAAGDYKISTRFVSMRVTVAELDKLAKFHETIRADDNALSKLMGPHPGPGTGKARSIYWIMSTLAKKGEKK